MMKTKQKMIIAALALGMLALLQTTAQADPVIPEPMTMLLLGSGLAGMAGVIRRRKRQQVDGPTEPQS